MLSSFLSIQNAMLINNAAAMNMMNASDRLLNSVSFGNSQPLRPISSFASDELVIKANETKITVGTKLLDSLRKRLGKDIIKSAPKYAGIDYKA